MRIKILAFGITKDITGTKEFHFDVKAGATAADLKAALLDQYPPLLRLNALAIAINGTYATEDVAIQENDEIVLIPPVSGG